MIDNDEVNMAYTVIDVADYIVAQTDEEGYPISNLKLQKILYFVQAVFLSQEGKACFDEAIEAWSFGPVVPAVYRRFRIYGSNLITGRHMPTDNYMINSYDSNIIKSVIKMTRNYSAADLVEITHHQEPWIKAYKCGRNKVITKLSIKEFFEEK